MHSLPDIPELESVSATSWGTRDYDSGFRYTVRTAVVGAVISACIVIGGLVVGLKIPWGGSVLVVLGLLVAIWPLRTSRSDFYFETSETGLLVRGWLRQRFIEWSQINRTEARDAFFSSGRYVLETDVGPVELPRDEELVSIHLAVSVWQHLRREGREDGFDLPPIALGLWRAVDGDLPRHTDWVNPRPPNLTWIYIEAGAFVIIPIVIWAIATISTYGQLRALFLPGILLPSLSLCRLQVGQKLQTACRVSVREDGIDFQLPAKTISIPWSEVSDADWWEGSELLIQGRPGQTAAVPACEGTGWGTLVLAIIRRLREREHPLLIPLMDLAESGGRQGSPG